MCVGGGLGGGVEGHWRGINSRKLLERMLHFHVCGVGVGLGGGVEGHWRGINSRKLLERMFHRHVCVWGGGRGSHFIRGCACGEV